MDPKPPSFRKKSSAREYPCKFCQAFYPSSDLTFKMTLRMIYETIVRVRVRLDPKSDSLFLQLCKANRSILALDQSHGTRHIDSSILYHSWRVCTLCYNLYEKERALSRVEKRFSHAIGLPINGYRVSKTNQHELRTNSDPLTLCRMTLMFQLIYNVPKSLFHQKQSLSLKFQVLDLTTIISLNSIVESPTVPGLPFRPRVQDQNENLYWIPIHLVRTFHFFAPETPLEGKVRENMNGLGQFFNQTSNLSIQLIDNEKEIGSTRIRLEPFKSSFVTKQHFNQSMGVTGDRFNLVGIVAFERLKLVSADRIAYRSSLVPHQGVFLPPPKTYCTSEPLHHEWLDALVGVEPPQQQHELIEEKTQEEPTTVAVVESPPPVEIRLAPKARRVKPPVPDNTSTSTWCITVLLHQTHNFEQQKSGTTSLWEGHYSLFGRDFIAIEKGMSDSEIEFNSSHKIYVSGSLDLVSTYFKTNNTIVVRLCQQSERRNHAESLYCPIQVDALESSKPIDGTFDIDTDINQKYPPYLSASIYISRVGKQNASQYSIVHVTAEGIKVLTQIAHFVNL